MPNPDDIAPPDAANTAAAVVSYFPDDQFRRRLQQLRLQFAAVFWIDNTPPASADEPDRPEGAVHRIVTGKNVGLASALNLACRAAMEAGFDWVITFDQDSLIERDFLERQISCWLNWNRRAFILGCNYTDSIDKKVPRFAAGAYVRDCRTVITSGSLMSLALWDDLGEFRDDYFIDGIDHEICLRARARGLLIARHGEVLMQHQIGQSSPGLGFFPYVQPAARMYYSTRNGVRNIAQYLRTEPLWAVRKAVAITWEGCFAVLRGPERGGKFRAIRRGLIDGARGAMGEAPDDFTAS